MIVDPDFLDHWRTRMLVDALGGDELAPLYLLRLWGHCQTRKATRFEIPAAGLKGLCKATGDAKAFEQALIECGYLARDGAFVEVLKWAEQNASLIAAWENGGKGGRPPKLKENPRVQDEKPTGNPAVAQGEPEANPDETDKRGLDKTSPSLRSGERATRLEKDWALPEEWRKWAEAERPELDISVVACKFADHWHAKGGAAGRKVNWFATWRNWVRDERAPAKRQGQHQPEETQWFDTRSGVERKAREFGIGPWNETEEHWPQYRQRVMKAAKGDSGGLTLDQLAALAAGRQGAAA